MKNIVVVGCGNIGSRHIQALTQLPYEMHVDVVDPNLNSQKLAQTRIDEMNGNNEKMAFNWYQSITDLKEKKYDLSIVATTAINRNSIVKQLLEQGSSTFLIEKMVCQSIKEYEQLKELMKKFGAIGWVNTNLRYFSSWQKIKDKIDSSKSVNITIVAPNTSALGTNAIHYLDLFAWLIEDYSINLNGEFLINELFSNKRGTNLVEFAGTLIGKNQKNSLISMTFIPNTKIPTTVSIVNNNKHIIVNETNQNYIELANNEINNFSFEHVSSTTTKIVEDILTNNKCLLTTIDDSFYLHKEIINVFNKHIEKITKKQIEVCPIT